MILPKVNYRLDQLVLALYNDGYFGFMDSAINYVNAITDFIYTIPQQKHYKTSNKRYGAFYCRYKPNKNTTYYITFDTENGKYLVKNIITNHTREYPIYISGE